MKNRVVYYGDSFISDKARPEKLQFSFEKAWPAMLAEKLGREVENLGRDGVGFDYITSQFTYNAIDGVISSDDLIIMGSSSWDRKWMVTDHPGASHLINLSYDSFRKSIISNSLSKDRPAIAKQMEIASEYYVHGWNQTLVYVEQIALLNHIRAFAKQFNLNVLIIPTFEHYTKDSNYNNFVDYCVNYQVSGFLNISSMNEFYGDNLQAQYKTRQDYFTNRWGYGFDIRPNHLSVENHRIMTNKLYDTITNKVPLNLEEGFVKDIYN